MSKTYVLDASAVLDLIEAGPGFVRVEQLLQAALRNHAAVLISVLNVGEVFYLLWQRRGQEKARQTIANLSRLPVEIAIVDFSQAIQAGELKTLHKIPYVDCVTAALAVLRQATLVTSDRDFEKLGRHFPILWIDR
ncbi:MAG: type II toxin-antitoxin system VapC family toxin [Terriglobales bacterium]